MDEDPNAKEIPAVELSASQFPVYVIAQDEGDLVITPSMAIYQMLSLDDPMVHLHWNHILTQFPFFILCNFFF